MSAVCCLYGLLSHHIWKCQLQNAVRTLKSCVLLYKSPWETLQMLEDVCGKAAMKKMQVCRWHKCWCSSVNDDLCCGWVILRISSTVNLFQKGVLLTTKFTSNSSVNLGKQWKCPEKWTQKQLVSSARQCMFTSGVGGQNVPCQAQCDIYGASAIFLGLVSVQLCPVTVIKKMPQKDNALLAPRKSLPKLWERWQRVSKNGFQEYFRELYEHMNIGKSVTEGNVV
jgi:hypothetical protein